MTMGQCEIEVCRLIRRCLSLRPGGGGGGGGGANRGSRFLGPRFDSSSSSPFGSSSDLPVLRPHGGAPSSFSIKAGDSRLRVVSVCGSPETNCCNLGSIPVVDVPEDILKIKQEIEAELFGEDQNWGRGESNLPNQSQSRYSEPDNRDWRGRSAQLPASGEERSWFDSRQQEANQFNRQDQLNSSLQRLKYLLSKG
ncbi:Eukaryotic translation initiation factor isoform 4G-1 [Vitis vinifera]|uniref:Eukaryotic translation initiation factor isoform 4G-1 n=1 Tax=Vitis vinifera TaxID=29760 RepID=A0A438DRR8_VITVI|nr:Eukaryotic translation initiation factor isoform 4G-1 [Vitis vinifera]